MPSHKFLVTGAMGCLGAWTVRLLLDEGADVLAFDLSRADHRLRLLLSDDELRNLPIVQGDITDGEGFRRVVEHEGITHIVHLAALQVPLCKADPVRGARVNVEGTLNVFEVARARADQVQGLSYASSVAVFGPPDLYPGGVAGDESPPAPNTLYGAYKLANEGSARVYARDYGVSSVGLRPFVVYGPGRDQGLTSAATLAMLAAAAGNAYHIGHGGTLVFHYAPDVARVFIDAARAKPTGAHILNIGGTRASIAELIATIEAAVPDTVGAITFDDVPLPFPTGVDASGLDDLLGPVFYTPLSEAVVTTVETFRDLLDRDLVMPPAN
jgi:UDP-glucuronate 4-epimerase